MSKIFVAPMHDYNNGRLLGAWVDVDRADVDDLWAEIVERLTANGAHDTEEILIHDYEGFAGYPIREADNLAFILRMAELTTEHGHAFTVFVDYVESLTHRTADELDVMESRFIDAYQGNISAADYAADIINECYDIPENIRPYVDVDKFARDLIAGGDVTEVYEDGEFYLFHNL